MKNELLAKYILGEANTKEGQRVEEWLGESEDHQREFRQLKRRIELGSKRYKYGVFANLCLITCTPWGFLNNNRPCIKNPLRCIPTYKAGLAWWEVVSLVK